jgi:sigma-B regulation protein RsbU (phosphoserine phosphatase)
MKILVAEDDAATRAILVRQIDRLGHDALPAADGDEAWRLFLSEPVEILVTDWVMPGLSGLDLCRRVRGAADRSWAYVLLLTGKTGTEDVVEGLDAGADEFMSKPYDAGVLRARLHVGMRLLDLERSLRDRVRDLEAALAEVKTLRGLLPICSYCKQIRTSADAWQAVEAYVAEHSDATFSHGVCPTCYAREVAPAIERVRAGAEARPKAPPRRRDAGKP